MIRGYWRDPRVVRWTPAETAELDTRVACGHGAAEVWFGATWVYSPVATNLDVEFHGHPQTPLRWTLNGQRVAIADKEYKEGGANHRLIARKSVALRAGWNLFAFRGFCVGYAPFRAGIVLTGPEALLWSLKLSGQPPEAKD